MKIKKCPFCNFSNSYNAMFCKCGYDLSSIMPSDEEDLKSSINLEDLFCEEKQESEATYKGKSIEKNNRVLESKLLDINPNSHLFDLDETRNHIESEKIFKIKKFFLKDLYSDFFIEVNNLIIIGRQSNNDLLAQNLKTKSAVSRKHAELSIENNAVYIEDLNSKNGTFINDRKLSFGEKIRLQDNDIIGLGEVKSKINKDLMALFIFKEREDEK